jgi:hypothetical protein
MIHLLFLFTILSGITQETFSIFNKQSPKSVSMIYALGSIFFLFWHEPFISLTFIWGLFILAIVDFIVGERQNGQPIKKFNTYICLILLIGLILKYLVYFN